MGILKYAIVLSAVAAMEKTQELKEEERGMATNEILPTSPKILDAKNWLEVMNSYSELKNNWDQIDDQSMLNPVKTLLHSIWAFEKLREHMMTMPTYFPAKLSSQLTEYSSKFSKTTCMKDLFHLYGQILEKFENQGYDENIVSHSSNLEEEVFESLKSDIRKFMTYLMHDTNAKKSHKFLKFLVNYPAQLEKTEDLKSFYFKYERLVRSLEYLPNSLKNEILAHFTLPQYGDIDKFKQELRSLKELSSKYGQYPAI